MAFETVFAQVPFFAQLSSSSLSELSSQLNRRRYERDQTIFHKNDEGSARYIILSGKVKIILPSPEGENVIVALLSTGDFFGELSLFDNESPSASAVAAETAEMLTLDQPDVIGYVTENPKASISILAELSLRRTDELLSDAAFCNLPTRLAKRLLELSGNYGQLGPDKDQLQAQATGPRRHGRVHPRERKQDAQILEREERYFDSKRVHYHS